MPESSPSGDLEPTTAEPTPGPSEPSTPPGEPGEPQGDPEAPETPEPIKDRGSWRGATAILTTVISTLIAVFELNLAKSVADHGFNMSAGGGGSDEGCLNSFYILPTIAVGFLFGGVFLAGAISTIALGYRRGSKFLMALGTLATITSVLALGLAGRLVQLLIS